MRRAKWLAVYEGAGHDRGMQKLLIMLMLVGHAALTARSEELLFSDTFRGRLGEGWNWIREHRDGWRATANGLEIRVEPGNMWGPPNNARNVLVRPLPETEPITVAVSLRNRPTEQYEQVDLVWYYDDSHMVKIGQELVDGQLSVVMGREEADRCRTIAIVPLASDSVRVRFTHRNGVLTGDFRVPGSSEWRLAGECTVPAPTNGIAKASLQFYQGPPDREHWVKVRDFRITKRNG